MRRLVFLAVIVHSCFQASTQPPRFHLTNQSVVRDSSGKICAPAQWKEMFRKGYFLKPIDPTNPKTTYVIYRMTDAQRAIDERTKKPKESNFFRNGEKINSFQAVDIKDNSIDLEELEGKIIVLNFWFINCQPCRKEIPALNALVDSFRLNDKVVFIAVGLDDKVSITNFLKMNPFDYSIIDNGKWIARMYHLQAFPTHVVIDSQQHIYFHTTGLSSNTIDWLRKSINELLAKDQVIPAAD